MKSVDSSVKTVSETDDEYGSLSLEYFSDGRKILLNPSVEEVAAALAIVQQRCRKNVLSLADSLDVYHQVAVAGQESAHAGLKNCPTSFRFGVTSTVIEAVLLAKGLVGCSIGRKLTQPGEIGSPIVRADLYAQPRMWKQQAIAAFWTALRKDQITLIEQRAVTVSMAAAAERECEILPSLGVRRVGYKRDLQLNALFRSIEPTYISELALALKGIASQLKEQGRSRVAWSNFQQQWTSIAMRYKRDLLGIFKGSYATVEKLENYRTGSEKYSIKFTTWEGAQTIFPGTQIVFQVESPLLSIENGVGHWSNLSIRKSLRTLALASEHPVTALTVGWLRVHVDDLNRLCFIDEVQSDVVEHLLQMSADQGNPDAEAMSKDFIDWLVHGFVTVQHWAHCIGYRVAMHTRMSAESVGNKTASERKWNVYYGSLIKRFRLVEFDPLGYFAAVFVEPRVPSLANPNSAVQHGLLSVVSAQVLVCMKTQCT